MSIEFSPRTNARMQLRHLYDNLSCLPSGTPTGWDKELKGFDPELSLRLAYRSGRFLIFYDHHSTLSVIASFGRHESFGRAFANVRYNSIMNSRKLAQIRKEINEAEEKKQDYDIEQCAEEFAVELHHSTHRRVINDNVDMLAPEKPSLGGVIL